MMIGLDKQHDTLLPLELIDMILIHLVDDKKALYACSLLCRPWRYISQRYLFRACNLTIGGMRTFNALAEFLQSSPHLATCVESVRLSLPYMVKTPPRLYHSPIYLTDLPSFLKVVPALHTVHFDGIFREMGDIETLERRSYPVTSKALEKMVITNVDEHTDAMLLCILLFAHIKEIHLPKVRKWHLCKERWQTTWWDGCCPLFSAVPPALHVGSVVFHHPAAIAAFVDLTERGCRVDALQSISLTFWLSEWRKFTTIRFQKLIRAARNIRHIHFKLLINPRWQIEDASVLWRLVFVDELMSKLPHLKSVKFAIGDEAEDYQSLLFDSTVAAKFPCLVRKGLLQ